MKAWIRRVRREDFVPTSTSYVCSRHFLDSDFTISKTDTPAIFKKKKLLKSAIPSLNLRGNSVDECRPIRSGRAFLANRNNQMTEVELEQATATESQVPEITNDNTDDLEAESDSSQIVALQRKLQASNSEVNRLEMVNKSLEEKKFLYKNLKDDEVKKYTGIEKPIFEVIIQTIKRFMPFHYWAGKPVKSISSEDQLLILLMRLKLDIPYFDIAKRYSVSHSTIQNIIMTYLYALHRIFFEGMMSTPPSQEKNKCSLPESFGDITNCRIIIDCTEVKIATPRGDLQAACSAYSNYKHNLTAKFLIGVAPNGAITFVSDAFLGSTSDKVITDQSGIISHLKAGDLILADKGFLIHDLLPNNIYLNLPAFLSGKTQFTKNEAIFSRKIAGCRIHVERAIERLRNYKILDNTDSRLRPFLSKIVQVCAVLVNFQSPIISGVLDNYVKSTSFADTDI